MTADRKIKVVIVDDSALMRQLLTKILSSDAGIEVVGAAPDPYAARAMIRETNPDVVTLDIEMPKMDGLEFLEKIMRLRPTPVVMVSSLTQAGADATLQALELGAIDFIGKPAMGLEQGMATLSADIIAKVKAAAGAQVRPHKRAAAAIHTPIRYSATEKVVAVGASTGGVEALRYLIGRLPADSPALLVTQHMPANFTASFATRLDGQAQVTVMEARDGVRVLPGHVYVAPGGRHLELGRSGANYICKITDDPPVSGHKPSVDVLFHSFAERAGAGAVGIILTGMGKDGAKGLKEMREAGARTFGQDERSCVVYGMPKAAYDIGAVEKQCSLSDMPQAILDSCAATTVRAVRV